MCPLADVDPQNILDPRTNSRSVVHVNLRMRTNVDPSPTDLYFFYYQASKHQMQVISSCAIIFDKIISVGCSIGHTSDLAKAADN